MSHAAEPNGALIVDIDKCIAEAIRYHTTDMDIPVAIESQLGSKAVTVDDYHNLEPMAGEPEIVSVTFKAINPEYWRNLFNLAQQMEVPIVFMSKGGHSEKMRNAIADMLELETDDPLRTYIVNSEFHSSATDMKKLGLDLKGMKQLKKNEWLDQLIEKGQTSIGRDTKCMLADDDEWIHVPSFNDDKREAREAIQIDHHQMNDHAFRAIELWLTQFSPDQRSVLTKVIQDTVQQYDIDKPGWRKYSCTPPCLSRAAVVDTIASIATYQHGAITEAYASIEEAAKTDGPEGKAALALLGILNGIHAKAEHAPPSAAAS